MSTLFVTTGLAAIILLFAILGIGISWVITGKSRVKLGTCGRDPTKKKKDCSEETSCSICEKTKK